MSATEAARTDAAAAPSSDDLVARIRELQPLIEKNAAQGEADRRVVEESITALTDAGVFKVAQPRRYGGYQASVRTMLDVSAAVAEADGGTAWVVALCNVCAWLTGLFSEQAQDDVWGTDPGRQGVGGAHPERRGGQGRRRIPAHRPLVLQLGVVARELGDPRLPDPRRRRPADRPGSRADPVHRPGDRGDLVRRRDELVRLQLPDRHRRVRARAPDHVGPGRHRGALPDRARRRGALPLRVRPGARAGAGRTAARAWAARRWNWSPRRPRARRSPTRSSPPRPTRPRSSSSWPRPP